MFRPMIHAPMLLKPRAAKSSSVVIVPPSWPNIRRKVRVAKANSSSVTPPTPRGSARSWLGPAPQPSTDIAVLWTRNLGIRSPISTDVYHRTDDAVWQSIPKERRIDIEMFRAWKGWHRRDRARVPHTGQCRLCSAAICILAFSTVSCRRCAPTGARLFPGINYQRRKNHLVRGPNHHRRLEWKSLLGNCQGQARTDFALLDRTLKRGGASFHNLATMTVFINDPRFDDHFVKMRHVMFPDGRFPASALITVSNFGQPGTRIEIQGVAIIGD